MNNQNIPDNFNPILSVAGEPLPQELVKALKDYHPTQFQTKNKEELLSMLIKDK